MKALVSPASREWFSKLSDRLRAAPGSFGRESAATAREPALAETASRAVLAPASAGSATLGVGSIALSLLAFGALIPSCSEPASQPIIIGGGQPQSKTGEGGSAGIDPASSAGAGVGGASFGGSGSFAGSGMMTPSFGGSAAAGAGNTERGGQGGSGGASARGGAANRGGASNGGATAATGGSASSGGGAPSDGCAELVFTENVTIAKKATDRFAWSDAHCQPRSAAMARVGGGYVRQFTYQYDGKTRTATGTGANGHNGWGYAVSHDLTGSIAQDGEGTFEPVFVGKHHALYEYRVKWPRAEDVVVIISWFFATGRDNPVLAITYDLSAVAADKYKADARTPYGDIAWDGDENVGKTVVSGVGWGDRYKFITTKAPVTMNSPWDYSKPNIVPYVLEWADASDAEMGAVQTQTQEQHHAGGYWAYENWGKTSANQIKTDGQAGLMPITWNWPYQMNQYELCGDDASCDITQPTSSHRLAWGMNYGAVGQRKYPVYGDDAEAVGYPYQSYSVSMVLGKHSDAPVFAQVSEIETVQKAKLTASVGSIASKGLAGVGRTDQVTLSPVGYDHIHSLWLANAADNALTFSVALTSGSLQNPVMLVQNYTSSDEPQVSVDGTALVAGKDYFVSLDAANKAAYITFHTGWSGSQTFEIHP